MVQAHLRHRPARRPRLGSQRGGGWATCPLHRPERTRPKVTTPTVDVPTPTGHVPILARVDEQRAARGRRLARSTAIFALATGVSRVLGLVREIVAAYYFGAAGKINA